MSVKSVLVGVLVTMLLGSPILLAHVVWRLGPIRHLGLTVVDYSVPSDTYWNHKGLFWLLNHLRIAEPKHGGDWEIARDYIGYDPKGKGTGTRIAKAPLDGVDWIYLSDTYGVHVRDRKPAESDKIENGFIFGGLSLEDAEALAAFVGRGNSLISEFNSISDPTPKDARAVISSLMAIAWQGWSGRFVVDFTKVTEQYPWFETLYRQNYGNRALPKGPGMMLIHASGTLVVLSDAPFEESMPTLALTPLGKEWMNTPVGTPPYYGWFGVVATGNDTEVLAELVMPTPLTWEETFRLKGVPRKFPLITRKRVHGSSRIYIAANLSVVDEVPTFHSLAFLPRLLATIHRRRDSQHHGPTFWQFFVPVVGRLLTDAATSSAKTKDRR